MSANTIEQRRHRRHEIPLQGTVGSAGTVVPCRVHNISAGGALIEAGADLRIGDQTVVRIPDFGTLVGRVVRVSSTTAGIAFEGEAEAATDAFIVEWLNLENATRELPERNGVSEGGPQAV